MDSDVTQRYDLEAYIGRFAVRHLYPTNPQVVLPAAAEQLLKPVLENHASYVYITMNSVGEDLISKTS
jgi:hypothetical protein